VAVADDFAPHLHAAFGRFFPAAAVQFHGALRGLPLQHYHLGNRQIQALIALHKGSDNFMSLDQFKKFYWPTLRELLLELIKEGLTPVVLAEGVYTSRLETISDIPEGKVVYWFEHVDMAKAKAVVGRKACIMGDVPMSLLSTGTVAQVKEYCKKLIDTAGKDGGFIMSSAANLDDAKLENARALIDCTQEYGVY
jgi:uroporphyrinogen-III decarboxylase